MIGAGRVGKLHSTTICQYVPEAQIVALVDPATQTLEEAGREFDVENRFSSLEEAIDQVDFDAVAITTPTFTHCEVAVLAAQHKKHIFLEKPMAMTLSECDKIIAATKKNNLILQLGFMRRFEPEFAEATRRIHAGEIGEPMMVKSLTNGPGLPPAWANDLKTSNGMLAEVNSHDLDCVRWLAGSNIERIYVETANFKGEERGVTTEHFYDNMLASIRFESGALGNISGVCPCDYGYDARVEIVGKKGIMQIGQMQGQAVIVCTDREHGLVTPISKRWPERFAWGYIFEMQHFIECIQTETKPQVTGEDGRWVVAAVLAGTRSFLEERPVSMHEILA
jgi:myo-inositol 2-dehydrogenase/D-chiro-inositol 1-dehydrogenase/scyllo-inositol 2-dehydrogenase (NAD+)